MKKAIRRMGTILAGLLLAVTLLPAAARAEDEAQPYDLYIAGTQVTGANAGDLSVIEGVTGTASYDAASNTLNLNGAGITGGYGTEDAGGAIVYKGEADFTIEVSGMNTVTGDARKGYSAGLMIADPEDYGNSAGKSSNVAVNIAGGASLTLTGGIAGGSDDPGSYGIYKAFSGRLKLGGAGTLTAEGGESPGSYGIDLLSGDTTVEGSSTVNAGGGQADKSFGLNLNGNLIVSGSGTLNAAGGKAAVRSVGINVYGMANSMTVSSGTVNAAGGKVTADSYSGGSYGIYCFRDVVINGGTVTAAGGEIPADSSISSKGIFSGMGSIKINGGTVLAKTAAVSGRSSALHIVPVLGSGITAGGSVNTDGSGAEEYDPAKNDTYKWFKSPFAGSVAVTGVTLDKTSADIAAGRTLTLNAAVSPADAADKSVTWSSSDASIASVDASGRITGKKAGTAEITVKTKDGGKTASCKVRVLFTDVADSSKYYYAPVYWAVDHDPQVTAGTSDTTFGPSDPCTRAQIVTFLWKAAGAPEPKTTKNPFTDVSPSNYYYRAVLWAVENGITTGTSATTFSPKNPCTRAQSMTFLYNAKGKPQNFANISFTDVKSTSYYYNAVRWAVKNSVTAGINATRFGSNNTCTRAQIVTFLYKARPIVERIETRPVPIHY